MKTKFLKRLLPSSFKSPNPPKLSLLFQMGLSRNEVYDLLDNYFFEHLPLTLIRHRKYFDKYSRGFGENAFHSMWYMLFKEFKPKNCLEIGVYRGQTVSLWTLLANKFTYHCNISCISPFSDAGDEVSIYSKEVDYLDDTIKNFQFFQLNIPTICKDLSNSENALKFISNNKWDLIYIDGSHDESIVLEDFKNSFVNLNKGGILVFDDSSLYFDYKPSYKSFAGHPGPSKIVRDVVQHQMKLLGGVGHNNIFIKL